MLDQNAANNRDLKIRLEQVQDTIGRRLEEMETKLLREFQVWAVSFESRFRANEILVGGFNERLIAVEERLSDIEGKSKT